MNYPRVIRLSLRMMFVAVVACFLLAFACPLLQYWWCLAFPHNDHKIAVLPFDVECRVAEGKEGSLILPKGLMLYAPCNHDFGRMSLDETGIYKVYVKFDAQTLKMLVKDSDKSKHDEFMKLKDMGTLESLGQKTLKAKNALGSEVECEKK